jgi:hypothetical protein
MMRHLSSSKEWWQDGQTTSPAEHPGEKFLVDGTLCAQSGV